MDKDPLTELRNRQLVVDLWLGIASSVGEVRFDLEQQLARFGMGGLPCLACIRRFPSAS